MWCLISSAPVRVLPEPIRSPQQKVYIYGYLNGTYPDGEVGYIVTDECHILSMTHRLIFRRHPSDPIPSLNRIRIPGRYHPLL